MRKLLFFIFLLLPINSFATDGVSTVPALFFSDLTSGPKTGGKGNNGVFVSVYGKNFGASRGTSTITVNGTEASNYEVWLDTYAAFQMGSGTTTGNIVLTTSAGTSNGLAFTVRAGNIYFVDVSTPTAGDGSYGNHWKSPASYYNAIHTGEDGATCYFRAGTYNGSYGYPGWGNVVFDTIDGGTEGNENAFVGYPGEIATFSTASFNFRCHTTTTYLIIANLNCYAERPCVEAVSNWRVVGNIFDSLHTLQQDGIVKIKSGFSDVAIYGNEITGGASGNKLDHAIYANDGTNLDVGWNWIHDNNFGLGPMISNNKDGSNTNGWTFGNYHIHDNIINMSSYPSRAIGVADVGDNSTFYIYNNIIIGPSSSEDYGPTLYAGYSHVYYYNNTIYNCGNAGNQNYLFYIHSDVIDVVLRNNICYSSSTAANYMEVEAAGPVPINTNNCWYGLGAFADNIVRDCGTNANAVEADPGFTDPAGENFVLLSTSTCLNKGFSTTEITDVAPKDYLGVTRPQGDIIDIGAYEYFTGTAGSITNKQLYGTWHKGTF